MKAAIQNAVPLGLAVGVAMAVGHSLEETSYWLRILAIGLSGAVTAIVVQLILQNLLDRRSE